MAQVFQDCCRTAWRRAGLWGVLGVWVVTVEDLVKTVVVEHRAERSLAKMVSQPFIRWSGLASMVGGVLWLLLTTGLAFRWPVGAFAGPLFMGIGLAFLIGLLGLYPRYGGLVSYVGRVGIVLGAIGTVPLIVMGILKTLQMGNTAWPGLLLGFNLLFLGLLLLGVDALRASRRLPWAVLPLLIGGTGFLFVGIESVTSGPEQLLGLIYLFGAGWLLLGYAVWSEQGVANAGSA